MRKCSKCKHPKAEFPPRGGWCTDCVNAYNRARYQAGKTQRKTYDHDRWRLKRENAIAARGGRCSCCGETELGFLRVLGKTVVCFNCSQAAKRLGACPHKKAAAARA
jgi:hypothetical protein